MVSAQLKGAQKKAQRQIKPKPALESGIDAINAANSKLARALGSVDYRTREKGVQALTRFLQRKEEMPDRDMLKIWKGLFYAFWHSDKQPVQAELAQRLAGVMLALQPEVSFGYFTCFIRTMRREWFGIDRHRLDKFLMLIRTFVRQLFVYLASKKWQASFVSRYADWMYDNLFLSVDGCRAVGVAYHVSDLFLPEMKKAVEEVTAQAGAAAAPPAEMLAVLFQPFVTALVEATDQPLLTRVREGVFDPLLDEVRQPEEGGALRNLDVQQLARSLFSKGALPRTAARNRAVLYAISEALERALAKWLRKEGKSISASEGKTDSAARSSAAASASTGAAAGAAAGEPALPSGKKSKKRKVEEASVAGSSDPAPATKQQRPSLGSSVQHDQPARAIGFASSNGAAGGSGEAAMGNLKPGSAINPKSALKKQAAEAATAKMGAAATATESTPGAKGKQSSSAQMAAAAPPPSTKKRVQICLKKNLYFDFGGPVPAPDVRTPQTSRPKGGILKQAQAPSSAPAKVAHAPGPSPAGGDRATSSGGARKKPRARAALFF